jgi:bifunctional ADP-heptose synthase (sugar kinase/adenylyltransferase)
LTGSTHEALSAAHEATILGHCDRLLQHAPDGVIIEGYEKGLINQHTVDALSRIAAGSEIPLTADPTASNTIDWSGVTALKPNRHEAITAAGLDDRPGGSAVDEAGLALLNPLGSGDPAGDARRGGYVPVSVRAAALSHTHPGA